jgi:hypothetical protein
MMKLYSGDNSTPIQILMGNEIKALKFTFDVTYGQVGYFIIRMISELLYNRKLNFFLKL